MTAPNKPTKLCRACGALVPHDAPFGHCPSCLVQLGFGPPPEEVRSFAAPAGARHFGEYELLEQIGRGGMGVVYKARQVSLKRLVALKMLGPHASAFPGIAERLRLEAEVAGSLRHPQIVTIYDVGEHDGQPFFTMELIEGSGLDKFIGPGGFRLPAPAQETHSKRGGPEADMARMMAQIARAVDHAHKFGVLHRDLKPANILIDAKGEPHLTDFGLAKVLGRVATTGTASGAIMGTPAYMAPEQASGGTKHASTAADVYSLGAILYEMLTGHAPFRADTPLETLRRVVEEAPKPPSTFNRNLDSDLVIVCLKCLEKDPAHRYGSALAMAEDLERWSDGEPIEGRSVRQAERLWRWCRREPKLAGLAVGVFLLLTIIAVLSLSLFSRERSRVEASEAQKRHQRTLLCNRIENESKEPGRASVRIFAEELKAISNRKQLGGNEEVTVVLGLHANLGQPDQFLHRREPLLNHFYTNQATAGGPRIAMELLIYTTQSNAIAGMKKGEVDLMYADPAVSVAARSGVGGYSPLVREVYGNGQLFLDAAIFTRTNSGIDQITQLKGRRFAFGEAGSALEDLLPKAKLVAEGYQREDFLRVTNFLNDLVLAAVGSREWDAGVAPVEYVLPLTGPGREFKILDKAQAPGHVWLARKNLDPKIAQAVLSAFLAARDGDMLARFKANLTGFQAANSSDYDALEQDIETADNFDKPR